MGLITLSSQKKKNVDYGNGKLSQKERISPQGEKKPGGDD